MDAASQSADGGSLLIQAMIDPRRALRLAEGSPIGGIGEEGRKVFRGGGRSCRKGNSHAEDKEMMRNLRCSVRSAEHQGLGGRVSRIRRSSDPVRTASVSWGHCNSDQVDMRRKAKTMLGTEPRCKTYRRGLIRHCLSWDRSVRGGEGRPREN